MIGKKIKVLRFDDEGEYTSNKFKDFCKDARIKKEKTIVYKLQQNGVVERKNRSIISYVKCMIHDQSSLMFLWAKLCNTTLYV